MKNFYFLITTILLVSACAGPGTRSGSTEQRQSSDKPSWALVPPTAKDTFYAVGQAKKQNPSLASKTATGRARAEISSAVEIRVTAMLKDFLEESGVGETAEALEFSQAVTKQVSANALQGSVIKEAFEAKDGTVFILVEYSISQLKDTALNVANRQEALYNKLQASSAFKEMEALAK